FCQLEIRNDLTSLSSSLMTVFSTRGFNFVNFSISPLKNESKDSVEPLLYFTFLSVWQDQNSKALPSNKGSALPIYLFFIFSLVLIPDHSSQLESLLATISIS